MAVEQSENDLLYTSILTLQESSISIVSNLFLIIIFFNFFKKK